MKSSMGNCYCKFPTKFMASLSLVANPFTVWKENSNGIVFVSYFYAINIHQTCNVKMLSVNNKFFIVFQDFFSAKVNRGKDKEMIHM